MENFIYMLAPLFSMKLFIILFLGTLIGLILGVLPGLGPTTGGALILPFTIPLEPLSAIILLTAIYCAGTYGGAITAILINTPGTPAAAATCLDGYPLAQKGEAGRALGMVTVASAFGGIFSVFILVFFAPMLVGNWFSTWQEKGRHSRELLAKNAGKCGLKNEQLPIIVDRMTGIAADLDRLERGKSSVCLYSHDDPYSSKCEDSEENTFDQDLATTAKVVAVYEALQMRATY